MHKEAEYDQSSSRHSSLVTSKAISHLQGKLKESKLIPAIRRWYIVWLYAPVPQWEQSCMGKKALMFFKWSKDSDSGQEQH